MKYLEIVMSEAVKKFINEAVNEEPLVLYHGTDSDSFTSFNPVLAKKGPPKWNPLGNGMYATNSLKYALNYGRNAHKVIIPPGHTFKKITQKQWASIGSGLIVKTLKKIGCKPDGKVMWSLRYVLSSSSPFDSLLGCYQIVKNNFGNKVADDFSNALCQNSNKLFGRFDFVIFTDTINSIMDTDDKGRAIKNWEVVIFNPALQKTEKITESYDDEEDFAPELPETILPAGTTVYHGTAAKFSNSESLESPCWVTTSIDVAKRFVDWHQHSPKGKRRILQYTTTRPLTLLKIDKNTMNDLDEYHGVDTRDPHEMAEGVLGIRSKDGNRFDGWVISGNYHDGDDIMLGDSGVLSFVKTKILKEAHHEYDNIDYKTEFKPLKKNDTFRVFHGFYLMSDAVHTAKYGLTGAEYADRRYSYESNNNPKGLFVTLKLDVAKEFSSQVIIEFVAREDELEPPVWPGGGYTVQGQMAQYFPHGAAGRAARAARRKESGKETENSIRKNPNDMKHVMFSDDRYKAMLLFASREHQALYMGHLNPSRISAFWVSDQPQRDGKYATWSRLSVQDFLEKYGTKEEKRSYEKDVSRRVFAPEDNFDPELFKERITKAIRSNSEDANPDELMRDIYNFYLKDGQGRRVERFQQVMHHYLWPKQLGPALRWIMKNYSQPV